MNKHTRPQSGDIRINVAIFGGLIIVGVLVWVLWMKPSNVQKSAQTVQTTQNNQVQTPTTNTTPANANSPSEQPGVSYVTIAKWGVKVPILEGMGGFEYSIDTKGIMTVRSKVLNDLSGTCTDNSVAVVRGKAEDKVIGDAGTSDTTFKQAYDSTDVTTVTTRSIKAHVGDYYYVVPGSAGASCVQGQADQQKELDAEIAIVKALNQMVAE